MCVRCLSLIVPSVLKRPRNCWFSAAVAGCAAAHSQAPAEAACRARISIRTPPDAVNRWLQRWVDKGRRWLEALLWPAACLLCGRTGRTAISTCAATASRTCRATSRLARSARSRCLRAASARVCGECLRDPPPFVSSFVPYRYAYPLDHLVRGLKFRSDLACGRVLGELFARCVLARGEPLPEAIVPVPLAPRRYRAARLQPGKRARAGRFERCTGVTVQTDVVIRQRETAEQAGLDRKARRKNVRGAFAAVAPLRARSRRDPRRRRHDGQHGARACSSAAASGSGARSRSGLSRRTQSATVNR